LGNLNNTLINRYGLNILWKKLWFNDKIYNLTLNQINLIEILIKNYIFYGFIKYKNLYLNKIWYKKTNKKISKINMKYKNFYYIYIPLKLKYAKTNIILKKRIKKKNIYSSKLWTLIYQNWIIILWFFYQPFLKKQSQNYIQDTNFLNFMNQNFQFKKKKKYLFRIKYLYLLFNKSNLSSVNKINYNFS